MKRKLLIILLTLISIVCCAVALSACGGKKGGGNSSGNTQQTNPNGGTISGGDKDCEHQWGSWLTVSEATCTEKGKEERTCSVCGGKETKEISALGHSFNSNNICTRCGFELIPTVGLEYELITDKNSSYYAVTGLGNADAKEIVIPAYHAGKAVNKIAEEAFYGSDYITSVYLPGTINEIGKQAFYWCENLSELTISKSSSNSLIIKEQAFYGCAKLKDISLPDGVTEIYSNSFENTGYYKDKSNWKSGALFLSGWLLTTDSTAPNELTLDSSAKGIANNAFSSSNVTTLIMPDNNIKVSNESFKGKISNVKSSYRVLQYLPAEQITELDIIGEGEYEYFIFGIKLKNFINLTTLKISAQFKHPNTNNLELLNGLGKLSSLTFKLPPYTSYTFGELFGTTQYSGSSKVIQHNKDNYTHEYYIPSSLKTVNIIGSTEINPFYFENCTMIQEVSFDNSVKTVYNDAFYNCNNLKNVYFWGSIEDWCSISFSGRLELDRQSNPMFYADDLYINGEKITNLTIPNGVNQIKIYAFAGCNNIKQITLSDSVTSIGDYAFSGCTALESITIPDSVTSIGSYSFGYCTSLENVTIGNGVTSIGSRAFYNCTTLESIEVGAENQNYSSQDGILFNKDKTIIICVSGGKSAVSIPNSVTSIGNWAFYGCRSLTSVTIPDSVTSIGQYAFYKCTSLNNVTIGNGVTSIGYEAFYKCTALESVTIGNGVTSIYDDAFYHCTSLERVNITSIKNWCNIDFDGEDSNPLYYANNLYLDGELVKNLEIPEDVTSIGYSAFRSCTSLTSVIIPDSVTSIGSWAFADCTLLESVTIGNGVTSIGNGAFRSCTSLTSITIPDSVTSIGSYAFEGCTSLESVTIGNGVTEINDYAFRYCTSLENVTIGNGVTSIGSRAFYNCTTLESIIIPDSVTSIGSDAFQNCTALTSVTFNNTVGWKVSPNSDMSNSKSVNVTYTTQNAIHLNQTYVGYYWRRE